jgi:hypothetical protein
MGGVIMSIRVKETTVYTENSSHTGKIVSESFLMGQGSTLPLIFLEGEVQQRELHRPGLSMSPIDIYEEENPKLIKDYLCGFIDLPTTLLNTGSFYENGKSECIDFADLLSNGNGTNENGNFSISEVKVCPPRISFGSEDTASVSNENGALYETTTSSRVVSRSHPDMDEILDEFSVELEKKLNQNGFSEEIPEEEDPSLQTGVWWMKKGTGPEVKGPKSETVEQEVVQEKEPVMEEQLQDDLEEEDEELDELEAPVPETEFDRTMNGIMEIMDELENEKRGTEEERAKLWTMIEDLEDRKEDFTGDTIRTEEGKMELQGIVSAVEEKMNELKIEKIDSDLEKAEMGGMMAQISDKMTELELSQIGTEAEGSQLKRMMDGIQEKIEEIDDGGLESEVAKAELEGMLAKIEDQMTEFEISQLGSDAEKTQLRQMVEDLEKRISEMDGSAQNTELSDKLKGMEEKMAQMEQQLRGTEEKMEEMHSEMEAKRFTMEYIQNLTDRGELEALCTDVGLSCEGTEDELRNRLLGYVEGRPKDEERDERFTKENIENVQTKAELAALCEEAGLKKSGKKEELRQRLLDYAQELEQTEKERKSRFTKENIKALETKEELEGLCQDAGLTLEGSEEDLRNRLLEYVKDKDIDPGSETSGITSSLQLGAPDKLVYAVMGDMYKHLSLEMGDTVSDYVNDLEGFIRSILEVREELGVEAHEILKSVVLKPNKEKTAEVLGKLINPFLEKVRADNLEIVRPDEEWEGIKLQMNMDRELISANFKSQATKIQMLLRLQPPQKIRKIMEEKGEYTLGVEGYPVTISSKMVSFTEITPDNFEIREVEPGWVYIEKDIIERIVEDELPPPPMEPEEENAPQEDEPEEIVQEKEPPETMEKEVEKEEEKPPLPPPPPSFKRKKRKAKKKSFMGKLRKKWNKQS